MFIFPNYLAWRLICTVGDSVLDGVFVRIQSACRQSAALMYLWCHQGAAYARGNFDMYEQLTTSMVCKKKLISVHPASNRYHDLDHSTYLELMVLIFTVVLITTRNKNHRFFVHIFRTLFCGFTSFLAALA